MLNLILLILSLNVLVNCQNNTCSSDNVLFEFKDLLEENVMIFMPKNYSSVINCIKCNGSSEIYQDDKHTSEEYVDFLVNGTCKLYAVLEELPKMTFHCPRNLGQLVDNSSSWESIKRYSSMPGYSICSECIIGNLPMVIPIMPTKLTSMNCTTFKVFKNNESTGNNNKKSMKNNASYKYLSVLSIITMITTFLFK